jgi:hypothetical protein
MKLSSDTVTVLRNFSDINQNILFRVGNKLKTMSTMKNIVAKAEIKEDIEQEFGVYDLPQFLRAIDSFQSPVIKFNGKTSMTINDEKSSLTARYAFADKETLVTPSKEIKMPDLSVCFQLKNNSYESLKKLFVNLDLPDLAIKGEDGKIKLVALDKKNSNSNQSSISVGVADTNFTAYIKTENLKLIPGDYDVVLSKQKIAHFVNNKAKVEYWIALEADSIFN